MKQEKLSEKENKNETFMGIKHGFFFILGMFFIGSASGQSSKWDSTYRPSTYEYRVSQFESYPKNPGEIIFLGNSLTARADWNELLQLPLARNRGISGDITFGVLDRLQEVTGRKPAKLFILIGINDISRNISDSLIVRNYERIIFKVQNESPGTKIYFQTLLPVNNDFTQFKNHYNKDGHILNVNNHIKKLGEKYGIEIIDLFPHFLNEQNKLDKKYTEDGLHLNAAGYIVWAKILKKYIINE
ncbi:MAG: GDSL-type esterase/lipase family protein [Ginsengibacter sp.]